MSNTGKVVEFTVKQLLDCGAHFGHRTNYWNPKMSRYIYGVRNNTHIFNLKETALRMNEALGAIKRVASQNGKILFVGTKKQAQDSIASNANRCGQFYVNHRWLGGMMTNWNTISDSIKTLSGYDELLENQTLVITKKERLNIEKKRDKLQNVLGGIRTLGGRPDLLFVMDCRNESLAVTEAKKLGIPVVGVVDSNTDPDNIDYVIPANDDASKAIEFYCYLASEAALKGLELSLNKAGAQLSAEELIKLHQESQKNAKANNEKGKGKKGAVASKGEKKVSGQSKAEKVSKDTSVSTVQSEQKESTKATKPDASKGTKDKVEVVTKQSSTTKTTAGSTNSSSAEQEAAPKTVAKATKASDISNTREAKLKAAKVDEAGKAKPNSKSVGVKESSKKESKTVSVKSADQEGDAEGVSKKAKV